MKKVNICTLRILTYIHKSHLLANKWNYLKDKYLSENQENKHINMHFYSFQLPFPDSCAPISMLSKRKLYTITLQKLCN